MNTAMTFDERYRAIDARDARFDGQFITGVTSTGIYCRPSCPARTPKPANVVFYPTAAAAHEAGLRACKRCAPEASPDSPEWNYLHDVAGRAMRLIANGVVEATGVEGLAAELGYSSRQLTRIVTERWGAGPLALARAHRAQIARTLLTQTAMPLTEVAFAAGFGSVRQFNDTIREVFSLTPTKLRGLGTKPPTDAPGALTLRLPYREPFAAAALFSWLALEAVPGVEHGDGPHAGDSEAARPWSLTRALRCSHGPAVVRIEASQAAHLVAHVRFSDVRNIPAAVAAVRRLFDLDADPVAIDTSLAAHAGLREAVAATPGLRMPGAVDAHEAVMRTMVGQQISLAAARGHLGRIVQELGEPVPEAMATPEVTRTFPTPAVIAERGASVLRGPAARVRAVVATAEALADGSLTVSVGDDPGELREKLLARKGIGPWTADAVVTRVTGFTDAFLPGDSAVRAGARLLGLPDTASELAEWARRTSPWGSYVNAYLWQTYLRRASSTSKVRES